MQTTKATNRLLPKRKAWKWERARKRLGEMQAVRQRRLGNAPPTARDHKEVPTETVQRILLNTPSEDVIRVLADYIIDERRDMFRLGLSWAKLKKTTEMESGK